MILLLESATKVCSVALSDGNRLLACKESLDGNKHSEWMTVYIEEILEETKTSYKDLKAVAVSRGPGSYTGLRVAYSVAKGIAFRWDLPLIEVDNLAAMALEEIEQNSYDNAVFIPMIDARRMEVYRSIYDASGACILTTEAHILTTSTFDSLVDYDQIVLLGDGAHKVQTLDLDPGIAAKIMYKTTLSSAAFLRYEAAKKYTEEDFSDLMYSVPFYLKSPNITQSKKKPLV